MKCSTSFQTFFVSSFQWGGKFWFKAQKSKFSGLKDLSESILANNVGRSKGMSCFFQKDCHSDKSLVTALYWILQQTRKAYMVKDFPSSLTSVRKERKVKSEPTIYSPFHPHQNLLPQGSGLSLILVMAWPGQIFQTKLYSVWSLQHVPTTEICCTADRPCPPWYSFEKNETQRQRGCSLQGLPFPQSSFAVPKALGNTIYTQTQFSVFTFIGFCSGPDSYMFTSPCTWGVKTTANWTHQVLRP